MNREQALQIKEWRLEGNSWRKLSELAFDLWGEKVPKNTDALWFTKRGNQMHGRFLHMKAEQLLNELFD